MQLRANVFSKPDFQKEAQKNFVLVELDYPRGKEQSKEMKAANEKLAQQYGVRGFPTVVFADASGKPFGGFVGGRSATCWTPTKSKSWHPLYEAMISGLTDYRKLYAAI